MKTIGYYENSKSAYYCFIINDEIVFMKQWLKSDEEFIENNNSIKLSKQLDKELKFGERVDTKKMSSSDKLFYCLNKSSAIKEIKVKL